MTTIKIYQYGDDVFFLSSDGFKRGKIKSTHVSSSELFPISITYRVVPSKDLDGQFHGYEKSPSDLWDTYEAMLEHFKKMKP